MAEKFPSTAGAVIAPPTKLPAETQPDQPLERLNLLLDQLERLAQLDPEQIILLATEVDRVVAAIREARAAANSSPKPPLEAVLNRIAQLQTQIDENKSLLANQLQSEQLRMQRLRDSHAATNVPRLFDRKA